MGYLNSEFLRLRITELVNSGFEPIYVFIDGCDIVEKIPQNKECLAIAEEFKREELVVDILSPQSNLGQGKGIPKAINWFFSHQNFGLILEDDCQISPSLHSFISENSWRLLDPDNDIAALCASNIFPMKRVENIFLSPFFESWGWATSSFKWSKFYCENLDLINVEEAVSNLDYISKIMRRRLATHWSIESKRITSGAQDTWALRFTLGILDKNGSCILPSENQVLHVSHKDAIHVSQTPNWYKKLTLGEYRSSQVESSPLISKSHARKTLRHMYGISFLPFFWRLLGVFK
jgi:hypothetical protein